MSDEWMPIETIPVCDLKENRPQEVLLYSPQFGVRSGEAGNYHGLIFANVGSLHGNAVVFWGVTHWQPLPSPPHPSGKDS